MKHFKNYYKTYLAIGNGYFKITVSKGIYTFYIYNVIPLLLEVLPCITLHKGKRVRWLNKYNMTAMSIVFSLLSIVIAPILFVFYYVVLYFKGGDRYFLHSFYANGQRYFNNVNILIIIALITYIIIYK